MRILVHDANLLIDLFHGNLLEKWFLQGHEIHTTSLVIVELTDEEQKVAVRALISSGVLMVSDVPSEEWGAAAALSHAWGVSVPDASVAMLARKLKAVLMTGDGKLRKKALAENLQVKGTLWVLDDLVDSKVISHAEALASLEKILDNGSFLPRNDCLSRKAIWGKPSPPV